MTSKTDSLMDLTSDEIAARLSRHFNPAIPPENPYVSSNNRLPNLPLMKAAVLIPFLRKNGEWHILLIRRTQKSNDIHSGQVAFPGGRCSPQDPDAVHAAFRETFEETGIPASNIQYLGRLGDLVTITGYQVSPIVGSIPWPYPLVPQPEEVSRIFTIPLEWLINPTNRRVQQREHAESGNKFSVIYYAPYDGEVLWGASARITQLLLEALALVEPNNRYTSSHFSA
jgi:8-oxo-dGTP pyrophosphatase MutT (NUDIX family)